MECVTDVHPLRFRKAERLRHRSLVDNLFAEGKSLYDWPLRLTWRILDDSAFQEAFRDAPPSRIAPLQMMVTVPKKKLRHATDRVRMRRLIREAYRLNRGDIQQETCNRPDIRTLSLGFVYIAPKLTDYATVEKKMKRLLDRLQQELRSQEELRALEAGSDVPSPEGGSDVSSSEKRGSHELA